MKEITMNQAHIRGKLKNRLNRLRKKVKDAPADRQGNMTSRIRELEGILRIKK